MGSFKLESPALIQPDRRRFFFRDFLRIFFSRPSVFLFTFAAVTGLVLISSWLLPPKYKTSAKILVKERKIPPPLQGVPYYDFRTERMTFLQSQAEILRSDEVARRVLIRLFPDQKEISSRQIKSFQQNTRVVSPEGFDFTSSDVIIIQVSDRNPVLAAEAANLLPQEGMNFTREQKEKAAQQTIDFLEKQSQAQLDKMRRAEELMKNFEGLSSPELAFLISTVKGKGANADLITTNHNYLNARTALKEAEVYLNRLREMVRKGLVPQKLVRENPALSSIKNHLVNLESQLAALRSQYADGRPENATILKEIDQNRQLFNKEMKSDLDGRSVDVTVLEVRVKTLKEILDRYSALAQKQFEYSKRVGNFELQEERYRDLLREIEKARFSEAMNAYPLAHMEFIDKAEVPMAPVRASLLLNTLVGMLMGLILGGCLSFLLEYRDPTFKSAEEVERWLKISVLGSVPHQ
jgi:polysaccharide biosynthesis transport protein